MDAAGNFWLFGGDNNGGYYFNDLWSYSPTTNQWTWFGGSQGAGLDPGSATWPGGRTDMTVFANAFGTVYIFGGTGWNYAWDGVWQFGQ
jgi:hypothetical protein